MSERLRGCHCFLFCSPLAPENYNLQVTSSSSKLPLSRCIPVPAGELGDVTHPLCLAHVLPAREVQDDGTQVLRTALTYMPQSPFIILLQTFC